jgi:hypothetical protein
MTGSVEVRKWKKNLDVAASVLGSSIGEWAYAKLNGFGSVVLRHAIAQQLVAQLRRRATWLLCGGPPKVRYRLGNGPLGLVTMQPPLPCPSAIFSDTDGPKSYPEAWAESGWL